MIKPNNISQETIKENRFSKKIKEFDSSSFDSIISKSDAEIKDLVEKIISLAISLDTDTVSMIQEHASHLTNVLDKNIYKQLSNKNIAKKITDIIKSLNIEYDKNKLHENKSIDIQNILDKYQKEINTSFKLLKEDIIDRSLIIIRASYQLFVEQINKQLESISEKSFEEAASVSDKLSKLLKDRDDRNKKDILQRRIERYSRLLEQQKNDNSDYGKIKKNSTKVLIKELTVQKVLLEGFKKDSNRLQQSGVNSFTSLLIKNATSTNKKFKESTYLLLKGKNEMRRMSLGFFGGIYNITRSFIIFGKRIKREKSWFKKSVFVLQKLSSAIMLPIAYSIVGLTKIAPLAFKMSKKIMKTIFNLPGMIFRTIKGFASGLFNMAKNLITLPKKLINNIVDFLNKPIIKRITDFIMSDIGAAFLGSMTAIIEFIILKPLSRIVIKLAQKYYINELKEKFLEWKSVRIDKNNRKIIKINGTDQLLIDKYQSEIKEIEKENRIKKKEGYPTESTLGFEALIIALKFNKGLKYAYNKFSEKYNQNIQNIDIAKFNSLILLDNQKNYALNFLIKMKRFIEKSKNLEMPDSLNKIIEKTLAYPTEIFDNTINTLADIGISTSSTFIGTLIGRMVFPGLGHAVGYLAGWAAGELINWLRRKAKINSKAIEIVSQDMSSKYYENFKTQQRHEYSVKVEQRNKLENEIKEMESKDKNNPDIIIKRKQLKELNDFIEIEKLKGNVTNAQYQHLLELKNACENDIREAKNNVSNYFNIFNVKGISSTEKDPKLFVGNDDDNIRDIKLIMAQNLETAISRFLDPFNIYGINYEEFVKYYDYLYNDVYKRYYDSKPGEFLPEESDMGYKYNVEIHELPKEIENILKNDVISDLELGKVLMQNKNRIPGTIEDIANKNSEYSWTDDSIITQKYIPIDATFKRFIVIKRKRIQRKIAEFDEIPYEMLQILRKKRIKKILQKRTIFASAGINFTQVFSNDAYDQMVLEKFSDIISLNDDIMNDISKKGRKEKKHIIMSILRNIDREWYIKKFFKKVEDGNLKVNNDIIKFLEDEDENEFIKEAQDTIEENISLTKKDEEKLQKEKEATAIDNEKQMLGEISEILKSKKEKTSEVLLAVEKFTSSKNDVHNNDLKDELQRNNVQDTYKRVITPISSIYLRDKFLN